MDSKITPCYHELVSGMRGHLSSGKTQSLEYRMLQLGNLMKMLDNHKDELIEAIHQDFRKSKFEIVFMEYLLVKSELVNALNHLEEWMQFQHVPADLFNKFNKMGYRYEPYGTTLIIGAWNYPLSLTLQPLIGAVAAGNCVILKPSELSPTIASLFETLFKRYMDEDCYTVVNGGIPESTALLKERFDYIFYTGSTMVGRIVMKAAVENLTPVTLELGGKSPCYVASDCNFDIAANRILWAKLANCGQTCLAPDYVMCHKKDQDKLIESMKKSIVNFFGENPKESPDYARVVNSRHFKRLEAMIVKEKVAVGGDVDEIENYISPTIMTGVTMDDAIMKEEIFGPILPILLVDSFQESVDFIRKREKPLAVYIFTNNKHMGEEFVEKTSSGSACVNDCIVQAAVPTLPFGGVGESGMGAYHHKFTFETFSHKKSCLMKKQAMESVESLRYPPYKMSRVGLFSWLMVPGRKIPFISFLPYCLLAILFGVLYQMLDIQIALKK